jgi:hypothetical protein
MATTVVSAVAAMAAMSTMSAVSTPVSSAVTAFGRCDSWGKHCRRSNRASCGEGKQRLV